jgi:phosphate transport system permease protein
VFIQFMHLPQSAPLVGGLVLTLMTLPTIIISTRASLKAVPPSIRDAALGVGASKMQAVFHHVLPLAMPGHPDRHDHRPGAGAWRDRAASLIGMVGFVARGYPDGFIAGLHRAELGHARADLHLGRPRRPGLYEKAWGGIIILLSSCSP